MTSKFLSTTSQAKLYQVIQIILWLWSYEQNFNIFDQKFNNLGLVKGMNLKFYTSMATELKLKIRKF